MGSSGLARPGLLLPSKKGVRVVELRHGYRSTAEILDWLPTCCPKRRPQSDQSER